jgi:hypothetical protein
MKGVADNNTIKTPPITQTNKQQKRFLWLMPLQATFYAISTTTSTSTKLEQSIHPFPTNHNENPLTICKNKVTSLLK